MATTVLLGYRECYGLDAACTFPPNTLGACCSSTPFSVTTQTTKNKCSYDKDTKLSKEQTQRQKLLQTEGFEAWQAARTAKDYALFAPKFKEVVELEREIAATVDPDKDAYTAAMDRFEKGMTAARIDEVRACGADTHACVTPPLRVE